jgi:Fe-S-cluster containining protein
VQPQLLPGAGLLPALMFFFCIWILRTIVDPLIIYIFQKNQKNQKKEPTPKKVLPGIARHVSRIFISPCANNRSPMAEFVCDWCGKCCRSFGEFIRIERQLTERDYYCRYGITNDLFLVHVQPGYAEDISGTFLDKKEEPGNPEKKCAFLRKNPDGEGFVCVIYPTRPPVCRKFRCYRMLIRNREGHQVGKVIGQNELRTADEALAALWKEQVSHIPHTLKSQAPDPAWIPNVMAILEHHGYCGDPVE